MRIRSRSAWAAGVLGLVPLIAGGEAALGKPRVGTCTGAKAAASTAAVAARARCQAKARAKGIAVDGLCLAKVDATLLTRFAKAEKAGSCAGDAAAAQAVAAECMIAFDGATAGDASCAARKIKAAGPYGAE